MWDDHYGAQPNPYGVESFKLILKALQASPDASSPAMVKLIDETRLALDTESLGHSRRFCDCRRTDANGIYLQHWDKVTQDGITGEVVYEKLFSGDDPILCEDCEDWEWSVETAQGVVPLKASAIKLPKEDD